MLFHAVFSLGKWKSETHLDSERRQRKRVHMKSTNVEHEERADPGTDAADIGLTGLAYLT